MVINLFQAMLKDDTQLDERTERLCAKADKMELETYRYAVMFFVLFYWLFDRQIEQLAVGGVELIALLFMIARTVRMYFDYRLGTATIAEGKKKSGNWMLILVLVISGGIFGNLFQLGWLGWLLPPLVVYLLFVLAHNLYVRDQKKIGKE